MGATARLNLRIGADSRKFRRGMTDVKRAIAGVVASLGAIQFSRIAIGDAVTFEKRLLEIGTIARTGKKGLDVFREGIFALGTEIGATTEELTGGLYDALSAGIPNEKALTFLKVAAKAAIAGVTDTKTSVSGLVSIINAYSLSAEDAERVSDAFFTTIRLGKTTFPELSQFIGQTASIAAQAGVGFEELMASIATMTKAGIDTNITITSLKAAITRLIKPVGITADLIHDMGFETGRAAIAQLGFQGTMQGLADKAKSQGIEVAKVFENVRALNSIFNLTGDRMAEAKRDFQSYTDAVGASSEAFGIFEGSTTQNLNRLNAALEQFRIKAGEEFFFAINDPDSFKLLQQNLDSILILLGKLADAFAAVTAVAKQFESVTDKIGDFVGRNQITQSRREAISGSLSGEELANLRRTRALGGSVSDSNIGKSLLTREDRAANARKSIGSAVTAEQLERLRRTKEIGGTVNDTLLRSNISGADDNLLIQGQAGQLELLIGKGVAILEKMENED